VKLSLLASQCSLTTPRFLGYSAHQGS
jgi:hypothetical protein